MGKVLPLERNQYAKGVNVLFTPKPFIKKSSMDEYIEWWHKKVIEMISLDIDHSTNGIPCLSLLDSRWTSENVDNRFSKLALEYRYDSPPEEE